MQAALRTARLGIVAALASLALFLALWPLAAHSAEVTGKERILNMDVSAVITEQGDFRVTERIVLEATGREIRRGIVRVLPRSWTRPDGSRARLQYVNISVQRDGARENWHSENAGGNLELFLGSSERMLSRGIHEYVITYTVKNALLRKDGIDSLYWNVTGNDWIFNIEQATFRLSLPGAGPGLDDRIIERDYYTGRTGEQYKNAVPMSDGSIYSRGLIAPGEGLTVYYSWPSEITRNTDAQELQGGMAYALLPSLSDPLVFLPTLLLGLFYGYYARRWREGMGAAQPVIPLFQPPDGMLPGDISYVLKQSYNYKIFAADVLSLVNRRYLFLAELDEGESEKTRLLSRYPVPGDSDSLEDRPVVTAKLPPGGDNFYTLLFPDHADAVELTDSSSAAKRRTSRIEKDVRIAPPYSLAKASALVSSLHKAEGKKLFYPRTGVLIFGLFAWFFATVVYWGSKYGADLAAGLIGMVMIILIPFMFLFVPLLVLYKAYQKGQFFDTFKNAPVGLIIFLFIGATAVFSMQPWHMIIALGSELFGIGDVWGYSQSPPGGLSTLVLGLLFFIAALVYLPRRTREGQVRLAQAKGLQMYIKTAEQHRFQAIYPPEQNISHFEALLPYALALGINKTWADSFARYCRQVNLPDLERRGTSFATNSVLLSSSISRAASRSMAGTSSGSSSSRGGFSSGGGGRSGGGAGGGGGRGW